MSPDRQAHAWAMRKGRWWFAAAVAAAVLLMGILWRPSSAADPGVTANEIRIGNTSPYTGPLSQYGTIGTTLAAYFKRLNDQEGGVKGRKINFSSLDDAGQPQAALANTRKLVETENVFLILAPIGTATSLAAAKYLNESKIPQLFVVSSVTIWASPLLPWSLGWEPSRHVRGSALGQYIAQKPPSSKVGVVFSEGTLGDEFLAGLKHGLKAATRQVSLVEERVKSGQTSEVALGAVESSGAKAVIFGSLQLARPLSKFVEAKGWKPERLVDVDELPADMVVGMLGRDAANDIIAPRYLKDPTDAQWDSDAGMVKYKEFMKKYYPKGNVSDQLNVYAYSLAETFIEVLKQVPGEPTRDGVMRQAMNMRQIRVSLLLPDISINTSERDKRPISQVRVARFVDRRWQVLDGVYKVATCQCECKDGSCQSSCCQRAE